MGLERLIMVMEQQGCDFPEPQQCDLYIASMGDAAAEEAFRLTTQLRREGYAVQCDLMGRSVKAQMKYADKVGANFSTVLGDDELQNGRCVLKNMQTGEQIEVSFPDGIVTAMYDSHIDSVLGGMEDSVEDVETVLEILKDK